MQNSRISYHGSYVTSIGVCLLRDYTSFGSLINEMVYMHDTGRYRYGMNGQEKDDEIAGLGNINTADFWEYDTRLGRRWNVDPIEKMDLSGYSVLGNNPIVMIDLNGDDPVDPKTGKKFKINLYDHSIVYYGFTGVINKVADNDLLKRLKSIFGQRERNKPDGIQDGATGNKRKRSLSETSSDAFLAIMKLLPEGAGKEKEVIPSTYGAPNDNAWILAAFSGSYVFMDEYSESEWLRLDVSEYNIYKVEENYLTQIIHLEKGANGFFNISWTQSYSITKGEIKTREVKKSFLGIEYTTTEKYRTLTVESTTQYFENNKPKEGEDGKLVYKYTVDEIIE